MRDSVVFYRSFREAIKKLPVENQLEALWSIIDYGLDDTEPSGSGVAEAIYIMAKPQIDANIARYKNGIKGGRKKPNENQIETKEEPKLNQTATKTEPNNNFQEPNVNVNENENVNEKDKKESSTRFTPPTLENVMGYCQQMGYQIDCQRFIDFYASKGWMVGKNKMKDWKAALRNWARQDDGDKRTLPKKNQFSNYGNQRDYDADELSKKINGF